MARTTSFSLGKHFADFIEAQIAEGRYASVSDVVRDALRLLEEKEARVAALRSALVQGERSGRSSGFDIESFISRKREGGPSAS